MILERISKLLFERVTMIGKRRHDIIKEQMIKETIKETLKIAYSK